MCEAGVSYSGTIEVVGPAGPADSERVLAGVRLGWLVGLCHPSSKREHKKEGKFGGDEDNLVFYLVEFSVTTEDIWEMMPN